MLSEKKNNFYLVVVFFHVRGKNCCLAGCVTCSFNVQVGNIVMHLAGLLYLLLFEGVRKVLGLSES